MIMTMTIVNLAHEDNNSDYYVQEDFVGRNHYNDWDKDKDNCYFAQEVKVILKPKTEDRDKDQ